MMVTIDFVTGSSALEGRLKSKVGLIGISRKIFIFLIVAIAHQVDLILGDQHMLRDTVIFFYVANELLFIIENAGRMGVPIPETDTLSHVKYIKMLKEEVVQSLRLELLVILKHGLKKYLKLVVKELKKST